MFSIDPRNIKSSDIVDTLGANRNALLAGYGTLAPSSHNSQPWRFRISADGIDLFADPSRALPIVDPDEREMIMSCGAALEGIVIAARNFGLTAQVEPGTKANGLEHLAHIRIVTSTPPNSHEISLFRALQDRRTTRKPFSDEALPKDVLRQCEQAAEALGVQFTSITDVAVRAEIADLVARGDEIQFHDRPFRRELSKWVHSSKLGSRDGMSGADFGMPDVLAGLTRFTIRTFDMGRGIAASDREKIQKGSPVLAILATAADNRAAWLATGRALMRALATLTARGLTASYLNQPIEVDSLRPKLREVSGVEGAPHLLLRLGKCETRSTLSARRLVGDVIEMVG